MDAQLVFVIVLLGMISYGHHWISGSALESGSMLEVTVRRGDNVTLYCDCKYSTGVFIVWFRNCSHENQPPLVLRVKRKTVVDSTNPLPRFHFLRNESSKSYDLLILNVSDSDEGLYYCGTEYKAVVEEEHITQKHVYTYGNVTRSLFSSGETLDPPPQDGGVCWTLLFSLCPAFAVVSSLLSSSLVYLLCRNKGRDPGIERKRPDTRVRTRNNQDEDVCYAALEIQQASQRPKKKKTQSSDFSIYSDINTCRV